jgi:CheY-like chemotaxis protein
MTSEHQGSVGSQHADFIVGAGPAALRPGGARGRVLVVEDEDHVRDAMAPLLEREGYEVRSAENGREALRSLKTELLPDIILLDLRMPVMDGWEFRARQLDDPLLGRIPVVAVSADGTPQALAISARAFLRKPVTADELLGTIGRVLSENERELSASFAGRVASLSRLAAKLGHEIDDPLTIVLLKLSHSIDALRPPMRSPEAWSARPESELRELKARMADVTDMLTDCQIGGAKIRDTVRALQHFAHREEEVVTKSIRIGPPVGDFLPPPAPIAVPASRPPPVRGRILVVDDEPFVGRIIGSALQDEHDVFVVHSAGEAVVKLEHGETFELVLCDIAMPDFSGPDLYTTIAERWPGLLGRLVFLIGGAVAPEAVELMERSPIRTLSKPFKIERLKQLVLERMAQDSNG